MVRTIRQKDKIGPHIPEQLPTLEQTNKHMYRPWYLLIVNVSIVSQTSQIWKRDSFSCLNDTYCGQLADKRSSEFALEKQLILPDMLF